MEIKPFSEPGHVTDLKGMAAHMGSTLRIAITNYKMSMVNLETSLDAFKEALAEKKEELENKIKGLEEIQ